MSEMTFSQAVRIIERHLEGARGDVSERRLNAALLRVLPSLRDIVEALR